MSAAELLAECQARDIVLQPHGGQLDIDAPAGALTDELLQRLRAAKPALLVMLQPRAGGLDLAAVAAPRPRSEVPVPIEWPGAAADFCLLLTVDDLPATPFALNGWTTITDAAKFLRSVRGDIAAGPSGPRAFYGALQADLLELQQFVLQAAENEPARNGNRPS